MEDKIIETIKRICPICEKEVFVERRSREGGLLVEDCKVSFEEHYLYCPDCDSEFESGEILNENLNRAKEAYKRLIG